MTCEGVSQLYYITPAAFIKPCARLMYGNHVADSQGAACNQAPVWRFIGLNATGAQAAYCAMSGRED